MIAYLAGLPPTRLHDLRYGAPPCCWPPGTT
jgi:hypothetical protein